MTTLQFYFLFPSLFMLHELEEIIWMPSFVKKISLQIPYKQIFNLYTPFCFQCHCHGATSTSTDNTLS